MSSGPFGELEKQLFGKPSQESGSVPAGPPALISTSVVQATKWNTRLKRFLRLTANVAVGGYEAIVRPSLILNQFNAESYYPDEQLAAVALEITQNAGKRSIIQVQTNSNSLLNTIEEIQLTRLNTAGRIDVFWTNVAIAGAKSLTNSIFRDARLASNNDPSGAGIGAGNAPAPNLIGNNLNAAFAPSFTVAGYSGVASNPFICRQPWVIVDSQPAFLTFQPSIDNEGIGVVVFFRSQTPLASA